MYQPPHFREDRLAVQHALIRTHALGLLITAGPGALQANQFITTAQPPRLTPANVKSQ